MPKELISVIIPVYMENNEYLKQCIDSVLNQTYKNIEIIIIDDGMTDKNRELVMQYQKTYSNIKIIGKNNEGVSAARNKGIDASKGNWIVFVDSDDYIDYEYCEKMLKCMLETKSQCVACAYYRLYKNKIETIRKKSSFPINGEEYIDQVLNTQMRNGICDN